jgi:hypothetical protein
VVVPELRFIIDELFTSFPIAYCEQSNELFQNREQVSKCVINV